MIQSLLSKANKNFISPLDNRDALEFRLGIDDFRNEGHTMSALTAKKSSSK